MIALIINVTMPTLNESQDITEPPAMLFRMLRDREILYLKIQDIGETLGNPMGYLLFLKMYIVFMPSLQASNLTDHRQTSSPIDDQEQDGRCLV